MDGTGKDRMGPDGPGGVAVVAFVPDLMDRSKVAGAAGEATRFLSRPEELVTAAGDAGLVVADLTRPGVIEAVRAMSPRQRARCVVFANHTRTKLLEEAAAAGCGRVLARSAFFGDIASHLAIEPGPGGAEVGE